MHAARESKLGGHADEGELARDDTALSAPSDDAGSPDALPLAEASEKIDDRRARDLSPRYQPLVIVVFAASAGIVLNRFGSTNGLFGATFLPVWWASAAALLAWWTQWRRHREARAAWLLLIAVVLVGVAWHDLRWNLFGTNEIGRFAAYDSRPACVEVLALQSPRQLSAPRATPLRAIPALERSRLRVALTAIRDGARWLPASGTCPLVIDGHALGIHAGDRLRVFGQLARPAPPLNPGEFDFAAHARADRQLARIRSSAPECVNVLEPGSQWTRSSMLDALRVGLLRIVHEHVGPPRAGLAAALLLGAREGLPYDQTEPYLVTGTIHVLVVSGMNVAILAAGLLAPMRLGWVSRRAGLTVIIGMVIVYTLVAELQPPVVRAAVLGVLLCVAAWTGHRGEAFNSLAAAALVVLVINPADLFRAGPQLSFLAVAALLWIGNRGGLIPSGPSDLLTRMFNVSRPWYRNAIVRYGRSIGWLGRPPDRLEQVIVFARPFHVRTLNNCGITICWLIYAALIVWLVTLPLVSLRFNLASPISVPLSPAIWGIAFVVMWSGFLMLTIGWLLPPLGTMFGVMCNASLGRLEHLVNWAESLPYGHFWTPGPATWWVLGFYGGLIVVMLRGRALAPLRWQVAALSAWILIGLVPPFTRMLTRDELLCSFVAVGHGTCVVLEAPTGETLVYDAGALGAPEFATQSIASYLWQRGITKIDRLVISHADVDHYNALPGLLDRFDVTAVYVSPMMFDGLGDGEAGGGPQVVLAAIRQAGVPIREIWSGDKLKVGDDMTIDVLHPPRNGVLGNDNANSLTLAVEYLGRRLLLPGDLESRGLEDVLAELPYDCDVLLAPHHGSRQSDPPGFAAWSTPECVIISGGGDDEVRLVAETYRAAGAEVLSTADRGAVQVVMALSGIQTNTHRPAPSE